MKSINIISIIVLNHSVNIFAQSLMTNNVIINPILELLPSIELKKSEYDEIASVIRDISAKYKVRICSENTMLENFTDMSFTNATFSQVFQAVMGNAPGHTWRYEITTDTFYVHPETNAISMMRVGPISITNAEIWELFYDKDIFGFDKTGGASVTDIFLDDTNTLFFGAMYLTERISLEMNESYVWEVLDAICAKSHGLNCWQIHETMPGTHYPGSKNRYLIIFHETPAQFPLWNERDKNICRQPS